MSRGLCYGNGYFITVRARYGKAEDLIRLRYLAAPAATLTITKTCSTYIASTFYLCRVYVLPAVRCPRQASYEAGNSATAGSSR